MHVQAVRIVQPSGISCDQDGAVCRILKRITHRRAQAAVNTGYASVGVEGIPIPVKPLRITR